MFDHWKYTATREHGSVNNKENIDRGKTRNSCVQRGVKKGLATDTLSSLEKPVCLNCLSSIAGDCGGKRKGTTVSTNEPDRSARWDSCTFPHAVILWQRK